MKTLEVIYKLMFKYQYASYFYNYVTHKSINLNLCNSTGENKMVKTKLDACAECKNNGVI